MALLVVVIALGIWSLVLGLRGSEFAAAMCSTMGLAATLAGFFLLNRHVNLFEPIVLFSGYYVTVVVSLLYSIWTGFSRSPFVQNTTLHRPVGELAAVTAFLFWVGYVSALMGYYAVRRKVAVPEPVYEPRDVVSDPAISVVVVVFLFVGFANFVYNVVTITNGNPLVYLRDISLRYKNFAESGTTLGYLFAYNAMFVWFFRLLRAGRSPRVGFYAALAATIVLRASTARIFETVSYVGTFVGIKYLSDFWRNRGTRNVRYILGASAAAGFGVFLYFLRIASGVLQQKLVHGGLGEQLRLFARSLDFFLIDKGNIPNVGVTMKIVDSWGSDVGFLYGRSLVSWVVNVLPAAIRPVGYQPSVMVKNTWYAHLTGGALPPTGIGEMYANFGPLGPAVGMVLFGVLCAVLYNLMVTRKNYWLNAICVQVFVGFVMMYPKNEFDNLSLMVALPLLLVLALLSVLSSRSLIKHRQQGGVHQG